MINNNKPKQKVQYQLQLHLQFYFNQLDLQQSLLGGFNCFWTILEILKWINNFYFLNGDYPLNVKMLVNQLEWGDVINLPNVESLNQPNDAYYFEAPPKFKEKDVNP